MNGRVTPNCVDSVLILVFMVCYALVVLLFFLGLKHCNGFNILSYDGWMWVGFWDTHKNSISNDSKATASLAIPLAMYSNVG